MTKELPMSNDQCGGSEPSRAGGFRKMAVASERRYSTCVFRPFDLDRIGCGENLMDTQVEYLRSVPLNRHLTNAPALRSSLMPMWRWSVEFWTLHIGHLSFFGHWDLAIGHL